MPKLKTMNQVNKAKSAGLVIRKRLTVLSMSNTDLARKMSVTPQAVGLWARGKNLPVAGKLPSLCKCLGITLNELFGEKREKKND
jgi:transcriptional regulator with XRE-family HTH domain